LLFLLLLSRRPPRSTLFPYTRSSDLRYASAAAGPTPDATGGVTRGARSGESTSRCGSAMRVRDCGSADLDFPDDVLQVDAVGTLVGRDAVAGGILERVVGDHGVRARRPRPRRRELPAALAAIDRDHAVEGDAVRVTHTHRPAEQPVVQGTRQQDDERVARAGPGRGDLPPRGIERLVDA